MARLMKVAAVEPQCFLLGWLPHVAQLPLPRSWVLRGVRPKTPTLTNLCRNLRRDQVCSPPVHRAIAGRIHDQIGGECLAVAQLDSVLCQSHDIHPSLELDVTIGDEL